MCERNCEIYAEMKLNRSRVICNKLKSLETDRKRFRQKRKEIKFVLFNGTLQT
jgi:hypothetical protein